MTTKNDPGNKRERRRHERLTKKFSMRYSLADEVLDTNFASEGEIIDISAGGVRFLSPEELTKNTQLAILLQFQGWNVQNENWFQTDNKNDHGELAVIGVVMWSDASRNKTGYYEVGVRFAGRMQ